MATNTVSEEGNTTSTSDVTYSGFLTKQGGQYRNWKKRHFVLKDTTLCYYAKQGDAEPKGAIDLTTGRGVRSKKQTQGMEWPDNAKTALAFGLAVEGRTYYLYGSETEDVKKWRAELQRVIQEHGNPNHNWKEDEEGQPEPAISKVIRSCSKMGAELTKKFVKDSGLVDDQTAGILEGVADGVENQANANRDASATDRLKMATGDVAGVVGDNVDNDVVGVVTDVVKEQAEADGDVTLTQRAGLLTGTALQGTSEMVDNDIASGIMNTGGNIIHGQAEADTDATVGERIAIGIGSTAEGVGDSVNNDIVKEVSKGVQKVSEKAQETLEEDRKEKEKEDDSEED